MKINEQELKYIVAEATKRIVENNYRNGFTKFKAAKHAYGKKKGKSKDEVNAEISDYFAKLQAIRDMNQERNVSHMDPHERQFNNPIKSETFDTDFGELDDDFMYDGEQIDYDSLEGKNYQHEDYLDDIYYDRKREF